ncbi:hypothetical protein R75461_07207 [Paraburkholderia nemoris]|uniref:glycosyltransferase family 4 protein n=1 Tax=Paraburkholderia nemoris TaxID=2793076 RepID=UPI00190BC051|nr:MULTISPECIES: glycosyltransferase family 4 protein [Paraburkholderia]MBK3786699.1 glycosyltransferase family 4 protein [Paraburkholderia aspalathi]CAE6845008.1 hypothetical protein R75461_07207 [Paraburkholderia nemoris]
MRVLVVTNMLAGENPTQPSQGIFVSEQVAALRLLPDVRVDVISVRGFASRFAYLRSAAEVLLRVWGTRYDVVHYHFGLTAWTAALVRVLSRARIVVTLHGSDVLGSKALRFVTLVSVRFADACIAVSDEIRHAIRTVNPHCVTIPCAVNDALFKPLDLVPGGRPERIVVFPSSASRQEKDYPLFERVLAIVRARYPLPVFERHIDGLDRQEVCRLLQEADALLMTSKREGSPQSVKEAMACGLPVVSVNVGDVERLLSGVGACHIAGSRDPEELAELLFRVLEAGERSDGPRRLASGGYLSSQVAENVLALYRATLSRR